MAHPHASKIKFVKKALEKETGKKISYQSLVMAFDKLDMKAVWDKAGSAKRVKEVLVDFLRPAAKEAKDHGREEG